MTEHPETILVPLDGSKLASTAVDYAAMLAAATGARLVLFTVVGRDERAALDDFAAVEHITLDEAADSHLRHIADTIPDGVPVERHHDFSATPGSSIIDYAKDNDISMIVMASHGRSGVSRWLLGSVADKVVQTSPVPVTVIPVRP